MVRAGAYPSAEDALEAAVAAVESAASFDFEGAPEELDALIAEGLNSGEPVEADDAFWNRLKDKTDRMAAEHQAQSPRR